jgi:hypothetical protein
MVRGVQGPKEEMNKSAQRKKKEKRDDITIYMMMTERNSNTN